MTRSTPRLPVLVEGVVIVGSILLRRTYTRAIMVGSVILAVGLASIAVKAAVTAVLGGEILTAVGVFFFLGAPLIFLGCIALAAVYVMWQEQNDPDAFFEESDEVETGLTTSGS